MLTFELQKYLFEKPILFSFVVMSFLRKIYDKSIKTLKFSAIDPKSFEEIWSFSSTRLRVGSLIIVLIVILSILSVYLFAPFMNSNSNNDLANRTNLEKNEDKIEALVQKMEAQDLYIRNIQLILSGEVPINSNIDSMMEVNVFDVDSVEYNRTKSEELLLDKVQDDMHNHTEGVGLDRAYFASPVKGVVSQEFDKKSHIGIDIVAKKNSAVNVCLSGTIIYSGYSRKDGYIIIVEHGNGFTSVYKHNKTIFKKMGDKVKMGDPISIIGNTGENSDGPHLHFELWNNQIPVNPEDYINFKK